MENGYQLTRLQSLFQAGAARFAQDRLAGRAGETDQAAEYPEDLVAALGRARLLGLTVPREQGGQGAGLFELALALEELAAVCPASALAATGQNLVAGLIAAFGSQDQQAAWLADLIAGDKTAGLALPRPADLDPIAAPVEATRQGDGLVLNGQGIYVLGGAQVDLMLVPLKVEKVMNLLIISKGTYGLTLQEQPGSALIGRADFDQVVAPAAAALNNDANPASAVLARQTGLASAARAVGYARGALEYAVAYSGQREQFGLPIGKFPAVQSLLATMAARTEAARQLTLKAAAQADAASGSTPNAKAQADEATRLAAMARLVAAPTAAEVTTDAVQVCGGYGYTKDYPVEKFMRAAHQARALDGGDRAQVRGII